MGDGPRSKIVPEKDCSLFLRHYCRDGGGKTDCQCAMTNFIRNVRWMLASTFVAWAVMLIAKDAAPPTREALRRLLYTLQNDETFERLIGNAGLKPPDKL